MNAYDVLRIADTFRGVEDPKIEVCRSIRAGTALGGNELEIYEIRTETGTLCVAKYLPSPDKTGDYVNGHFYCAVMPQSWVDAADATLFRLHDGVKRLSVALNQLRLQDDIVAAADKHGVYNTGGSYWYVGGQCVATLETESWIDQLNEDNPADVVTACNAINAAIREPEERRQRELAAQAQAKSLADHIRAQALQVQSSQQQEVARPRRHAP